MASVWLKYFLLGIQPLHLLVSLLCNSYDKNCSEKKPQSLIRSNNHEDKGTSNPSSKALLNMQENKSTFILSHVTKHSTANAVLTLTFS